MLETPENSQISITKAIKKVLRFHRDRTGLYAKAFVKSAPTLPQDVSIAMINGWISGDVTTGLKSHIDAVIECWSQLPDCEAYRARKALPPKKSGRPIDPLGADRIPLTIEMSDLLRAELNRTGADIEKDILQAPNCPPEITKRHIHIWLYMAAKTTRVDFWNFVIETLRQMPDFKSAFKTKPIARQLKSRADIE